jgi:hypothetical protein
MHAHFLYLRLHLHQTLRNPCPRRDMQTSHWAANQVQKKNCPVPPHPRGHATPHTRAARSRARRLPPSHAAPHRTTPTSASQHVRQPPLVVRFGRSGNETGRRGDVTHDRDWTRPPRRPPSLSPGNGVVIPARLPRRPGHLPSSSSLSAPRRKGADPVTRTPRRRELSSAVVTGEGVKGGSGEKQKRSAPSGGGESVKREKKERRAGKEATRKPGKRARQAPDSLRYLRRTPPRLILLLPHH